MEMLCALLKQQPVLSLRDILASLFRHRLSAVPAPVAGLRFVFVGFVFCSLSFSCGLAPLTSLYGQLQLAVCDTVCLWGVAGFSDWISVPCGRRAEATEQSSCLRSITQPWSNLTALRADEDMILQWLLPICMWLSGQRQLVHLHRSCLLVVHLAVC